MLCFKITFVLNMNEYARNSWQTPGNRGEMLDVYCPPTTIINKNWSASCTEHSFPPIVEFCQTNKYVFETLGMKRTVLGEIKSRQIKYFDRLERHDTLLKFLLEGKIEGQRAKGRQRYKWEGNIKRWTNCCLAEWTIKARDRECWRSIAANLRFGDNLLLACRHHIYVRKCCQCCVDGAAFPC